MVSTACSVSGSGSECPTVLHVHVMDLCLGGDAICTAGIVKWAMPSLPPNRCRPSALADDGSSPLDKSMPASIADGTNTRAEGRRLVTRASCAVHVEGAGALPQS